MRPQFEYDIQVFDLEERNADLIKNVLNKKGREGFAIASVNEMAGYKGPKKIMYTLTREKRDYNPFEEPEFFRTSQGFIPPTSSDEKTFSSKVNNLPLLKPGDEESDF
ncbi:hypothetical protein P1X15_10150 [Runella sp. MFBS21]|uniref:hypothetical protein n=1 Tax=Runella sp. MFBS21 TaxID=3034018 RepID=UPI0023F77222|nr:hypothetical protein [Runella sp. MFBS21]MDF7817960.1 hypothetical protein [Runella sp. MFBS21]